ncbi:ribonuclease P protein component [Candidatus Kaiserbacteria bacterium]|nr:ribonuclease P protein component [Candidatus Kaiserbacteria bacterium]
MPRAHRLTVADLKAFRPSRRIHGTFFSLSVAPAADIRTACVVSKKVAARAVARNLIKRRVRSIFPALLPGLAPGHYVLYAKKDAAAADFSEIRADVTKLCIRASA